MNAQQLHEQIDKLTILSLKRLDKNLKLKDELIDLGDQYITAARTIDGLVDSHQFFEGLLKTRQDEIGNLLAVNAILTQQLKMKGLH